MAHRKIGSDDMTLRVKRNLCSSIKGMCEEPLSRSCVAGKSHREFYDFGDVGVLAEYDGAYFKWAIVTGRAEDLNNAVGKLGLEKYVVEDKAK